MAKKKSIKTIFSSSKVNTSLSESQLSNLKKSREALTETIREASVFLGYSSSEIEEFCAQHAARPFSSYEILCVTNNIPINSDTFNKYKSVQR